ncbi:ribonuclease-III-like-domain-containing protein [Hypoxylon trugodes]|uniref:ribonuclease-III-like-domain-containing protein n=1 Tax=Hypoxylon trugodes TaxID=326681 RepID=UPI00218CE81E|nr:ribonuclease-III-like-domain-containing protein [Hypoxylon trugodes]KAI1390755.1 ribonuclease-III-like-domain-containing protein [Hypoxylon trugodes]
MAFTTSRSVARVARQATRSCRTQSATPLLRPTASFSTSTTHQSEQAETRPRWAYTPERMKAPFSPHITKDPSRSAWEVNEDPNKLDEVLNNILGRDGDRMLPDELKWLAVTHKSFDQGRRGFNDRLGYLGRQICAHEATQMIITSPRDYKDPENDPFADRRTPYEDAALRSIDNLSEKQPSDMFSPDKLANFALETGLSGVVRWKPRMPENIKGSGFNPIMAGAVYALVGAVALQHGGKVSSRIVRERILKRLRQ